MQRPLDVFMGCVAAILLLSGPAPAEQQTDLPKDKAAIELPADIVGGIEGTMPAGKAMEDTIWIADWSFDAGGGCESTGWSTLDGHIAGYDGTNYWHAGNRYAGYRYRTPGGVPRGPVLITGNSAYLRKHDLCWVDPQRAGYGNNWDYAILCQYKGASTLSMRYLVDAESCCDYLQVEVDSAGASYDRVDYSLAPAKGPDTYRTRLWAQDGLINKDTTIVSAPPKPVSDEKTYIKGMALTDFGVPGTVHTVMLRFVANNAWSPEDGLNPTTIGAACVIDSIVVKQNIVTDPAYNYTEMFEDSLNINSKIAFINSANRKPFGEWARLYSHITDNSPCTENLTCAWLFTDPTLISLYPEQAYGPGQAVIRNWLDDFIISPWVSLASTPSQKGTVLRFRLWPGNADQTSHITGQWQIQGRGRIDNTDSPVPGDSLDCNFPWGHTSNFFVCDGWNWATVVAEMSSYVNAAARDIRVNFRVTDWQLVTPGTPAPSPFKPGPGPYYDRIRIGRRSVLGPTLSEGIDSRTQAQDCFPTAPSSRYFAPSTDRFGTCAFSRGTELGIGNHSPNIITGDSIEIKVTDTRATGGIAAIRFNGAISAGPHAGKAPPPFAVGANGFFTFNADTCKAGSGTVVKSYFFADLDDFYFRGGDALKYFWVGVDKAGGYTSDPYGMFADPASVAGAEAATFGLMEVNFLPTIDWDPAYLARIAADPNGKLTPTPQEVANSHQRNCLLYYNQAVNRRRRSTDLNRTSVMYTLDNLGYRGYYDTYDTQGYGNTNNQLGGRCSQAEATGYALIIHDGGATAVWTMPNGENNDDSKVRQADWYTNWLGLGCTSEIGRHTLWLIGENNLQEKPTLSFYNTTMGVTMTANAPPVSNPEVRGVADFTAWDDCTMNLNTAADRFIANAGCPDLATPDQLAAGAGAVVTHRYYNGATAGDAAIVMKANPGNCSNTIFQSLAWFHIRDVYPPAPAEAENTLMSKIFACALPSACVRQPNPTGNETILPRVTSLRQNVPNPFNPTTKIEFELAHSTPAELCIFDVAGRLVRSLADDKRVAGRYSVTWNGLDNAGRRVTSGVYLYRLVTDDLTATKKMVVLK